MSSEEGTFNNFHQDYQNNRFSHSRNSNEEIFNTQNSPHFKFQEIKTLDTIYNKEREIPTPKNPKSIISLDNDVDNYYQMIAPSTSKNNNEEENKLRMQIMEKDKIIFEYSKILKETERVLDTTKKLNIAKEEVISKLKDEMKDNKFKVKNLESMVQRKEEEFEKYKSFTEEKILYLNKEKAITEEKYSELTRLFENNQIDFQNTLIEYKKIEKQLSKLKLSFEEKDETLVNYEKYFEEMKKENKLIPSLKKQNNDYENVVKELRMELENERKLVKRIQQEKEDMENKLSVMFNDMKGDKESTREMIKLQYECERLNNLIRDKENEVEMNVEKYKNIVKENDQFVQILTSEVGNFSSFLENIDSNSSNNFIRKSPMIHKKLDNNFNQFSLKFELINKNFEILKNKISEQFREQRNLVNKLDKANQSLEKSLKDVTKERDNLMKETQIMKQQLMEFSQNNEELVVKHSKLTDSYTNLKESFVKVKTEFEDLIKKNTNICTETQLFLNNCSNKLREKFPDLNNDILMDEKYNSQTVNLNFAEKILYYIEILITDYNKLISNEKELLDSVKLSQIQIRNLEDEKELFKARIERILTSKENELKEAEDLRTDELRRQKEILYEKISSLTGLLEESNQIISVYENENKEIKERNGKLEYNLKMLTQSHLELE
jgi:hypothetical protein